MALGAGKSYALPSPRACPISCIATAKKAPPYSLEPQLTLPLMSETTGASVVGPSMPLTDVAGMEGATAFTSPTATVMPSCDVSTKFTPLYVENRPKISRTRCFCTSVIWLCSGVPVMLVPYKSWKLYGMVVTPPDEV